MITVRNTNGRQTTALKARVVCSNTLTAPKRTSSDAVYVPVSHPDLRLRAGCEGFVIGPAYHGQTDSAASWQVFGLVDA